MKKQKLLVLFSVMMIAVLVFSACTSPTPAATQAVTEPTKPPVSAATAAPKPAAAVEIVFWTALSGDLGKFIDSQILKFNESQNEVKVVNQFQGTYNETEQKFLAAIAAKDVPDMVMLERSRIPSFANAGAVVPLDDFINGKNGIDIKDFIPALVERHTDGKLYSLPHSRSMPVMYYNKDMFKAAGLDDSKPPATWTELKEVAQKLTKPDGSTVGFGIQSGGTWWYWQAAIEQNGGVVSDPVTLECKFTSPEAVEAIQWWYDLAYKDKVAKIVTGAGYVSWDNLVAEFANGKIGMMYLSTGSLANVTKASTFRVGVGPLAAGKVAAAPTGGNSIMITSGTTAERREAAWKFYKWLTDTPQVADWVMASGYMPTRSSVMQDASYKAFVEKNPNFGAAVKQLEVARPVPSIILHPKTQTITETMYEAVFVGNEPIQKSHDDLAKVIAENIAELKK